MPIAPPRYKKKKAVKDRYKPPESIFIKQDKSMYGVKWKKQRERFLLDFPLCVICNKVARVVDHIIPHKGDMRLFWDQSNWQPMCFSCHNRKTAREDGGWKNPLKSVDNKSRQN